MSRVTSVTVWVQTNDEIRVEYLPARTERLWGSEQEVRTSDRLHVTVGELRLYGQPEKLMEVFRVVLEESERRMQEANHARD